MNRCLRLFLCLPLLATTACAADAIAGPELAPATSRAPDAIVSPQLTLEAEADAQANPAVCEECIIPPPIPGKRTLYIVDGVIVPSQPELDAADLASVSVQEEVRSSCHHWCASRIVLIATRSGGYASQ